ncbi:MAG: type II secretion system protein GspD [Wenzhouxiangellaceae bacterium]|nr:type II secretion system protein GspD [Wenzhouxiangellaceae bacterium]MBS3747031.1 type II secretion system protein GspD [Wenzhouxiangellaceae bacterium]MBS3824228.1 type II secretion system protein GspD [Wenzhouxiangellaceae bacterium]
MKKQKWMLAVALALGLAGPMLQAQDPAREDETHLLNFQNADIRSLITTVADITGRNIVIDPAVSGEITVISSEELDAASVYEVFRSILAVHGYSAVADGSVTRIVPDVAARFGGAAGNGEAGAQDQLIRLIGLEHVRAAEVLPILRSLVPQSTYLAAHENSNSLLVSDRAAGVRRLQAVIRRLDAASDNGAEVLALSHANADEVAEIANQIYSGSEQPLAVPDTRTNSIVLRGDSGQRVRLRTLVSHLDTPLSEGSGARVVYLRYADADSLVPVLESLVDEAVEGQRQRVRINAHEETNSVVISAPPAVYREMRSIIDQLDIRRAQVLVEAIIAEVAADTGQDLGIQWQFFESGDSGFFGGTNFGSGGRNILNLSAGLPGGEDGANVLPGGGLNLGFVDGTSNLLGIELLEIGALAQALATDGNTNVLSTPSIVTMDNHSASINVGQEVPFLSGSFLAEGVSTAEGQVNPFQTIQREEVGLKLQVTPHINEGDTIMLGIEQEVSSLAPVAGAVDLITNKRTISTRVMVPDGSMLVLGGLITDDLNESIERVPGLSRIPLVGELFTFRSTNQVKRNLMVFIRPRILADQKLMDELTSGKYESIRGSQLEQREGRSILSRREATPLLPELEDFLQTGSAGRRTDER